MNVQTISGGEAVVNGQAPQRESAPRPGSTDALVDAALDALSSEEAANDNKAAKKVRGDRKAERAPEPADEVEGDGPLVGDGPGEEQEEEGEGEAPDESAQEQDHDSRGSKEEPFTVKDLPEDRFIKVKVDGEEAVIPLSELASGYIREQTFTRRVNKTQLLANEAQQMVAKARETQERVRQELESFLYDPDEIFDFFMKSDAREKVLEAAARRYAELRRLHRERPEERLNFQRRRDEERLAHERAAWQAQKEAEQAEQHRQATLKRLRETVEPGWNEGLRKAGFPKPTQQLWDEVVVRCRQKSERGEQVTSEDVAEFTYRAARLLELPPKGGKKRPQPAPAASARPANDNGRPRGEDGRWKAMPQHKRVADVDFYLRGLKTRDFR